MKRTTTLLLLALLSPSAARTTWQLDGYPVTVGAGDQTSHLAVADGKGGAIIIWIDLGQVPAQLVAQRIDVYGQAQWGADGVLVVTNAPGLSSFDMAADGAGGAIIAWSSFDIYAQRLDASGARLWGATGVPVCTAASFQLSPTIVSDSAGGAIISWSDNRGATDFDIYSQRVDAAGNTLWTADGVELARGAGAEQNPDSAPDGLGGAVVTWEDTRGADIDIYARDISGNGIPMGTQGGRAICTAFADQSQPVIVNIAAPLTEPFNDCIIVWADGRNGSVDVYAQRITSGPSSTQWTGGGVAIATGNYTQWSHSVAADGTGGAIIAWQDNRNSQPGDVYAQHILAGGNTMWEPTGVPICVAANGQYNTATVSDGDGGAVIVWSDQRNGTADSDVYAQRIDGFGNTWWLQNGQPVTRSPEESDVLVAVGDGAAGAIVSWRDLRGGNEDIYAQRIEGRYGEWGHPEPTVSSVVDVPDDEGGYVSVNWLASQRDQVVNSMVTHYSVWRSLTGSQAAGDEVAWIDNPLARRGWHDRTVIWRRQTTAGVAFWQWILDQPAAYLPSYSAISPTLGDSSTSSVVTHDFMVLAHDDNTNPPKIWESNAETGASVDNVSPPAPITLTANRFGGDVVLFWTPVNTPDLRDYSIYRASAEGVVPAPQNFLASATQATALDTGVPPSELYYVVTANDIHDNESDPSNEAGVSIPVGIGHAAAVAPAAPLTVLYNQPNPFTRSTLLMVGTSHPSNLHIEVFNVAGRRVQSFHTRSATGWQEVPLFARDTNGHPLPSGVYFYRVSGDSHTVQKKMVIVR